MLPVHTVDVCYTYHVGCNLGRRDFGGITHVSPTDQEIGDVRAAGCRVACVQTGDHGVLPKPSIGAQNTLSSELSSLARANSGKWVYEESQDIDTWQETINSSHDSKRR